MYGLLRGLYPLMDLHPAVEGYQYFHLIHDTEDRILRLLGLGLCDLPVTNFSALYVCNQILTNLGHALEYGLRIGLLTREYAI